MKTVKTLVAATTLTVLAIGNASATDYPFTVRCQDGSIVEVWKTGAIDPGKEYLRVATGMKHPGCSVADFNPAQDGFLPQQVNEGAGGVVGGIPVIGTLLDVFGL